MGLWRPAGTSGNQSLTDWARSEELDLLALYVLYHISEDAAEGTRSEAERAMSDMVRNMHMPSD